MTFDSVVLFILYFSFLIGLTTIRKAKIYYNALSFLVFSSTFIAGINYNSTYGALISVLVVSALSAYMFYMQYEGPPRGFKKNEDERSVGDVIVGYLLFVFMVFIFKHAGAGWFLSLLMSYWVFYGMMVISYRQSRKAFYLLKIPWVILSIGALIEGFGFQRGLVPFVLAYLAIFFLWIKFDLPEIMRPPKIA
ncbi:hypothetical protein [Thermococcus atlanticus]